MYNMMWFDQNLLNIIIYYTVHRVRMTNNKNYDVII
jgi:hypothetical protein